MTARSTARPLARGMMPFGAADAARAPSHEKRPPPGSMRSKVSVDSRAVPLPLDFFPPHRPGAKVLQRPAHDEHFATLCRKGAKSGKSDVIARGSGGDRGRRRCEANTRKRESGSTAAPSGRGDGSRTSDWEAAIDATSFVSDEVVAQLCDALGLIGAPGDCAGRIAEMAKLGVRNLYLMP